MSTATTPRSVLEVQIPRTQCFINGQWVDAKDGQTFTTFNPATEEKIADVAQAGPHDVDSAVQAARKAFATGPWHTMDARERGKLLYRLADLIEENLDELALLETLDNGKPISESRSADLPLAIDCFRYYAGWADKIQGETIPIRGNYFCYNRREPVGVVGQIIPWNFPILMVAWKWAPALAAGCTIVMKPAEQTPLTCLRLAELTQQAGFPDGVINVLPGFGDTGAAMVKHHDIDKIAFTGSTEVGQTIMRASADTLKRVTLELGGKSPNIVFADADMDAAAQGAYIGLFLNQGQCCCAGSRLFVEDSAHGELVDRLVDLSENRKIGDPFADDTEQGPQINKVQFDKILGHINTGKEQGAKCITGGERFGERGYFIQPTIFDGVKDSMTIAQEEIFGPVLSVLKFSEMDEVLARSNATSYGLAAAVWTRDISKAHKVAAALRAGTVWINCYDVFDAAAPFGGYKMSGQGRELGQAALENYTERKTVTVSLD